MANSFIGDLGRKYNRTNYGFTCQDLETAQNIWTQGLTDGKNITIDNFEDLYLIREQKIDRIYQIIQVSIDISYHNQFFNVFNY